LFFFVLGYVPLPKPNQPNQCLEVLQEAADTEPTSVMIKPVVLVVNGTD
jgi:hypothetical protein